MNDVLNLFSINWNQTKNITFLINGNFEQKLTFRNTDNLDGISYEYLYNNIFIIPNQFNLKTI